MNTSMKARAATGAEGNGSAPGRALRYRWTSYVMSLGNLLSPVAHHFALALSYQWMQNDGRVGRVLPGGRVESVSLDTIAEAMGYEDRSTPSKALRELREHGLLTVEKTGISVKHPYLYQATLPQLDDVADTQHGSTSDDAKPQVSRVAVRVADSPQVQGVQGVRSSPKDTYDVVSEPGLRRCGCGLMISPRQIEIGPDHIPTWEWWCGDCEFYDEQAIG
jgi:hypothetical protein